MSEWLKEHAWKVLPATCTKRHPRTPTHSRINELRQSRALRCAAVFVHVRRGSRARLTVSTQFPIRLAGVRCGVARCVSVLASLPGSQPVLAAAHLCGIQVNEFLGPTVRCSL